MGVRLRSWSETILFVILANMVLLLFYSSCTGIFFSLRGCCAVVFRDGVCPRRTRHCGVEQAYSALIVVLVRCGRSYQWGNFTCFEFSVKSESAIPPCR